MNELITQLLIQYPGIIKGYYSTENIIYGVQFETHINMVNATAALIDSLICGLSQLVRRDLENRELFCNTTEYNIPFFIKTKDLITNEVTENIFTISNLRLLEQSLVGQTFASNLPNFYVNENNEYPMFTIALETTKKVSE